MFNSKFIQNNLNVDRYAFNNKNKNNNHIIYYPIIVWSLHKVFLILKRKKVHVKANIQKNKNFYFCNADSLKMAYYQVKSNINNISFDILSIIPYNICTK
jgi:hypothetical protein